MRDAHRRSIKGALVIDQSMGRVIMAIITACSWRVAVARGIVASVWAFITAIGFQEALRGRPALSLNMMRCVPQPTQASYFVVLTEAALQGRRCQAAVDEVDACVASNAHSHPEQQSRLATDRPHNPHCP